jgi:hypothetical protein
MMQFGKANALVQCMLVICATLNVRFWSFEFGMLLFIWGGPFGRPDELFSFKLFLAATLEEVSLVHIFLS